VFREWVLKGQGLFALAEVLLFLGILSVGLVYVWAKRDLEWVKRLPQPETAEQFSKAA
jgi:NADH-quinone oxidoreductase subunit A